MTHREQKLKALEFFKDWSNYLLVTTVAALGWVGTEPTKLAISSGCAKAVVCLLVVSAIFAIFTLALIPLVGEKITDDTESIYDLKGTFRPFRLWDTKWKYRLKDKEWSWPLKAVCWPQHVFFIAGIVVFTIGVLVKR